MCTLIPDSLDVNPNSATSSFTTLGKRLSLWDSIFSFLNGITVVHSFIAWNKLFNVCKDLRMA